MKKALLAAVIVVTSFLLVRSVIGNLETLFQFPTSPTELQPKVPQNSTVDEPRDLREIVPGMIFRLTYDHDSKKSTEEQLADAVHHLAGNSYQILSTDTVVLSQSFTRVLYESHTNIVVGPMNRHVPVPGYVQ